MCLMAPVIRPSGMTHGRPPCSSLPSLGEPMVPNLVSSPRVLVKQALVLTIRIFLSWQSC
jgi:hypothetical protein